MGCANNEEHIRHGTVKWAKSEDGMQEHASDGKKGELGRVPICCLTFVQVLESRMNPADFETEGPFEMLRSAYPKMPLSGRCECDVSAI